jgi:hypothetical protein
MTFLIEWTEVWRFIFHPQAILRTSSTNMNYQVADTSLRFMAGEISKKMIRFRQHHVLPLG